MAITKKTLIGNSPSKKSTKKSTTKGPKITNAPRQVTAVRF
jgi:hypothetical protein